MIQKALPGNPWRGFFLHKVVLFVLFLCTKYSFMYRRAIFTQLEAHFPRKNQSTFNWQPHYHEHIIRNEKSYQRISNYIIKNPLNWE